MKKVKYKITGNFSTLQEGKIVEAFILNLDKDSGVALCYHPAECGDSCGSFEFIKKDGKYWISVAEDVYSNVGKIDKNFARLLDSMWWRAIL